MSQKLKEATFQKRLIDNLKKNNIRVKKLQSGMGYTVLDMYVVGGGYHPQFWEIKTIASPKSKIGLTTLQRRDILDEIKHGGAAGTVTCFKQGTSEFIYVSMLDEYVQPDQFLQERRIGEEIHVDRIQNRILTESKRLSLRITKGEFEISGSA